MRQEKLAAIFGKEGATKLRNHVKLFRDGDRILRSLQEDDDHKRRPIGQLSALNTLSDILSGKNSINKVMLKAAKETNKKSKRPMSRKHKSHVSFNQTLS